MIYDVCVVGSGAGAGPIIYELSRAGLKVCVLEKGDIYNEKDFSKDELLVRRSIYTPNLKEQYHLLKSLLMVHGKSFQPMKQVGVFGMEHFWVVLQIL